MSCSRVLLAASRSANARSSSSSLALANRSVPSLTVSSLRIARAMAPRRV
ncbi:MAG: hypothetical protein HY815_18595 [Candidatus Riflebacteria bacterium]|nr:hypothetical protein [Candidatus Riflebacteria bacterium]